MNSRELVLNTLSGGNPPRAPRQMWLLPWALDQYGEEVRAILRDYPDDIVSIGAATKQVSPCIKGDPYEVGEYTDDWGCVFTNIHKGVIGEVKSPIVNGDEWEDAGNVHIPEEWLGFDVGEVNKSVAASGGKFCLSGACPRPFEQLQFIRGTENLYIDLMTRPAGLFAFLEKMHDFYCRLLKKWALTDVDALMMMDDWGSQNSLLIAPALWDEIFAPLYKDYIDIAHGAGKKIFMHSDGYTLDIIPRLIDLGLDAMNAQIFCIGPEKLTPYRGKLAFWGEVDRQHLLPNGSVCDIENAVRAIYDNLWVGGGCIAQCEFGPGARPENVRAVFSEWDNLTKTP